MPSPPPINAVDAVKKHLTASDALAVNLDMSPEDHEAIGVHLVTHNAGLPTVGVAALAVKVERLEREKAAMAARLSTTGEWVAAALAASGKEG